MVWWKTSLLVLSSILLGIGLIGMVAAIAFGNVTSATTVEKIKSTLSPENAQKVADQYDATYSCGIIGCFKNQPEEGLAIVLLSKKAHNWYESLVLQFIVLVLVTLLLIVWLGNKGSGRLFAAAIPALVAGLLALLAFAQNAVLAFVPASGKVYATPALDALFGSFAVWYSIIFIIGIILLFAGVFVRKYEPRGAS
jgi:hypothetical protein